MDRYDLTVRELSALIGQTCHLWHELHCLGGEQVPFRLARQTHTEGVEATSLDLFRPRLNMDQFIRVYAKPGLNWSKLV